MPCMAHRSSLFFVGIDSEKERKKEKSRIAFYKMRILTVFYKNIDQYGSFS